YEPYSASKAWTLAAGADGSRNVIGCLKDAAGNTTNVSATVNVDTTPPGGATLSLGAATTTSTGVTVTMTTPETVTVALANESLDCSSATFGTFQASQSWTLLNQDGVRTVVACIKDNAGWVVTK